MAVKIALREASGLDAADLIAKLQSSGHGLTALEANRRLAEDGPNQISAHRVTLLNLLFRQVRNPILVLLSVTASVSFALGDVTNSLVILGILLLSVGLGAGSEFRAEKANEHLHSRIQHKTTVLRDSAPTSLSVTQLVVGDVVQVSLGSVIPADLRLLSVAGLQCDESIITGESAPVIKSVDSDQGDSQTFSSNLALMGTIVTSGSATALVIATGANTEFGSIAKSLGTAAPETDFQKGLRAFSGLLLKVSLILSSLIFVANALLDRPILESVMFSLAIAIGMTPQLLPAVVSISLAIGSRKMADQGVLVKRLASIEDLGDIDVLLTDKTGTLTTGQITYLRSEHFDGQDALLLGLLATESKTASAIDSALWQANQGRQPEVLQFRRTNLIPFSHDTRFVVSQVTDLAGRHHLIAMGSAEDLLPRCAPLTNAQRRQLEQDYENGLRVILVASRQLPDEAPRDLDAVQDLKPAGFLVFSDELKSTAADSIAALQRLGVSVKIATGDNVVVAKAVCASVGLSGALMLTGAEIDELDDSELESRAAETTVFARVSPSQKARIVEALRSAGLAVGFLGDGVNDAIALHVADVGISVDTATDVAKDAADIVLLQKDLSSVALGIREGRKVFSNTMKYALMGTSGDFGNMFSAALGSVALNFLPMTPSQVLLNDVLYDSSQLAIPSDRVDPEAVARPSHWNVKLIRRFMLVFGPISSIFDAATFALMLIVFQAQQREFQAGWFVESLATEILIIYVIRTRRVPFFRSRPSKGLIFSTLTVVAIGCYLPYSPFAGLMGFDPLPAPFFLALLAMVILYLLLVEIAKSIFFKRAFGEGVPKASIMVRGKRHRLAKRSERFRGRGGASAARTARPRSRSR